MQITNTKIYGFSGNFKGRQGSPVLLLHLRYSSATGFVPTGNGQSHGFYNAYTAYNPPPSSSISFWPLPVLTVRMLKDPIPGVTLDAKVIQNRAMPALVRK